jgi:hypothetical protein
MEERILREAQRPENTFCHEIDEIFVFRHFFISLPECRPPFLFSFFLFFFSLRPCSGLLTGT